jgi:hypothetical protein
MYARLPVFPSITKNGERADISFYERFDSGQKKEGPPVSKSVNVICALLLAALLLVVLPAAGCGEDSAGQVATGWVRTEIYCGRDIPSGGEVTEPEFAGFLDEVVTAEFPLGLTVFDAYGQMEDTSGAIVKQQTKVILLVYEDNEANGAKVQTVIDAYRGRFGNPQVMKVSAPTEPEFYSE